MLSEAIKAVFEHNHEVMLKSNEADIKETELHFFKCPSEDNPKLVLKELKNLYSTRLAMFNTKYVVVNITEPEEAKLREGLNYVVTSTCPECFAHNSQHMINCSQYTEKGRLR